MTGWDIVDKIIIILPPVVTALFCVAAGVMFMIGFSRYGMNFIKYGFKQDRLAELMDKLATKEDIASLRTEFKADIGELRAEFKADIGELRTEFKADIGELRTEVDILKVNHFGHLKNYLGVLNGILLDKGIIDNENKARLDNELRDM